MSIFSSSAISPSGAVRPRSRRACTRRPQASRDARQRLATQLKVAPAAFVYEEKGRPTKKDRRDLSSFIDRKRR